MRKFNWIIIYFLLVNFTAVSQELSLVDCIRITLENNIDLKSTILAYEDATISLKQAKSNRLPSLDLNYNIGQNYGRSIDPFTNGYVNQQLTFSNVQMNSSLLLFNGFAVKNEIKRSKYGLNVAELEKKQLEDELSLIITRAYYDALNMKVNLKLSEKRVAATKLSLEQVQKESKAGSGDPVALSDFQGQYAADQLRVIDANNLLKNAKLVLFQLMNIDNDENLTLEESDLEIVFRDFSVEEVFTAAMSKFEAFEVREQRINEAKASQDKERSLLMPSVFLFAGFNTNYSSAARRLNAQGEVESSTGAYIKLENRELPVLERTNEFSASNINYGNQLFENISPNFGISVNFPIFNQNIQKNRISRAKIAISSAELEKESLELEFRQVIEQAILVYNNVKNRMTLLETQVTAYEESLRINQVKLDNGVSNKIEYIISKNNLESAKLELANARFQLLIQQEIIDYFSS